MGVFQQYSAGSEEQGWWWRCRGGGFFIFFAPQTKAQFLSGLKRGVGGGAHREELEFLKRGEHQLFLMTVCLHGCSTTFQGKCGAGLVVTGLERNGPEENL